MARNASGATSVAKETLAYCTSCKMDLNHIIVAMKGERIAKVQCLTCKKEHVYRAPKGASEPGPKTSRAKKASVEEAAHSIEAEWEKLMATHKDHPVKPYSMKTQFDLGDKLHHPTFGDGIVGKLIYPNKLEVIFRNDIKVLIHAGNAISMG
ncbi:MAG: hypothetical protein HYX41_03320 [Bdellovibrio sp.]|nr:hypothetical protein [Bdellovibrio sp.]